ncbi:CLE09 protein [Senna tora]|uniref:CLE09 protein n=1 Tax=Senna tora TaxID=362788 RepID=A0A834T2U9_9FABA|nr:CLE09 protein [Senna tora]
MIIIIFLIVSSSILIQPSNCRQIISMKKIEERRRRRSRLFFSFPLPKYKAETRENYYKGINGIHRVSFTETPGGPNPLHN